MACVSCQQRREEIARIAAKVGTIVFGGQRRVLPTLAKQEPKQGKDSGERRA